MDFRVRIPVTASRPRPEVAAMLAAVGNFPQPTLYQMSHPDEPSAPAADSAIHPAETVVSTKTARKSRQRAAAKAKKAAAAIVAAVQSSVQGLAKTKEPAVAMPLHPGFPQSSTYPTREQYKQTRAERASRAKAHHHEAVKRALANLSSGQ